MMRAWPLRQLWPDDRSYLLNLWPVPSPKVPVKMRAWPWRQPWPRWPFSFFCLLFDQPRSAYLDEVLTCKATWPDDRDPAQTFLLASLDFRGEDKRSRTMLSCIDHIFSRSLCEGWFICCNFLDMSHHFVHYFVNLLRFYNVAYSKFLSGSSFLKAGKSFGLSFLN
jgi:hypothetical protein